MMNTDMNLLAEGTLLRNGTYRILQSLASGGFGNTYLVCHTGLDAQMVVKEFFMKGINLRGSEGAVTLSVSDNHSTFESQREKFKKEAQRLWRLKSPHIVGVHDIFEENGTVYYVMDYIDGQSLAAWLKQEGHPMPETKVLRILPQVLDALDTVHANGFQHLDLKPANIMMNRSGNILLIDFGASKQLDVGEGTSTSSAMAYTPGYAPREQVEQNLSKLGPWTDLYALGATLYHLVSGERPPQTSDIDDEGERAFCFPEQVSKDMRSLILWMMTPRRDLRPQSVAAVRERLKMPATGDGGNGVEEETVVEVKKSDSTPPPKSDAGSQLKSNRNIIIGVVAVCTALLIGVAVWRSQANDSSAAASPTMLHTSSDAPSQTFTVNGVSFNMIKVDGGTFQMGSTTGDDNEKPVHQVTLSDFYIGETEVTQALWQAVMGSNPSSLDISDQLPVENVSWNDCQKFITKLNAMTGKTFRLPTEAEWEFAARGGSKSKGKKYSGSNTIDDVAWYGGNSNAEIHKVRTKTPNELGLYDMSGNVWEWCQDWYDIYSSNSQINPTGPTSGIHRVCRGGSLSIPAEFCRVSFRFSEVPDNYILFFGLRIAL